MVIASARRWRGQGRASLWSTNNHKRLPTPWWKNWRRLVRERSLSRATYPRKPTTALIHLTRCLAVALVCSDKPVGYGITADDCQHSLKKIEYTLKPLDIVLIETGASRYNKEQRYLTDHCGMSGEATNWLLDQSIKMVGIDAPTWDRPVKSMFETKEFWPSHRVMMEREYYHLENMENLDAIPKRFGFKVSVLPIKWKGTTAAPVRAVAILEE